MEWSPLVRVCVYHDEPGSIDLSKLEALKVYVCMNTLSNNSPLHLVAVGNNFPLAKWLFANGAEITKNNDDQTALHWACRRGNLHIIKLLLSKMTQEEIDAPDKDGLTAYDWAIEYELCEAAKLIKNSKQTNTPSKLKRCLSSIRNLSLSH